MQHNCSIAGMADRKSALRQADGIAAACRIHDASGRDRLCRARLCSSGKVLINKVRMPTSSAAWWLMDDTASSGKSRRVYPAFRGDAGAKKITPCRCRCCATGLRTIVFGAGDTSQLSLRYMPVSSDIQNGDLLADFRIDAFIRQGIPVAKVDKSSAIRAVSLCTYHLPAGRRVDKHRHLLILSSLPKLPELPAVDTAAAETEKNPNPGEKIMLTHIPLPIRKIQRPVSTTLMCSACLLALILNGLPWEGIC